MRAAPHAPESAQSGIVPPAGPLSCPPSAPSASGRPRKRRVGGATVPSGASAAPMHAVDSRRSPERPATTLSAAQVAAFFAHLAGLPRLIAMLQYGCGLHLIEAVRLRVADLDLERRLVVVRAPAGADRVVPLPVAVVAPLRELLAVRLRWHLAGRHRHGPARTVPRATPRKPAAAAGSWPWQHVFAGAEACADPGQERSARLHLDAQLVEGIHRLAFRAAGIRATVSSQTLRDCCAAHLLERGCDPWALRDMLGHGAIPAATAGERGCAHPAGVAASPVDDLFNGE